MALNKIPTSFHFIRPPHAPSGRDPGSEASWAPNTDVYVSEAGLVIKVELAGLRREDLELTVEARRLRIRGVRRDCRGEAPCKFVVMEINYGHFESLIELPEGYDASGARAVYQNGFLRIDVPSREVQPLPPRSVPIESEDA
ncbi:MAG TPA: Hsp20/alpha crystallin family protein [Verrucomicrobiota bacterium]|nr:Hsp20/alpha crystallin family protein [Verrucomicrobiota bacterium]HNU52832.1 Hsp20/alpha crystallin family protein [Verrucomicrobiota bacterium]